MGKQVSLLEVSPREGHLSRQTRFLDVFISLPLHYSTFSAIFIDNSPCQFSITSIAFLSIPIYTNFLISSFRNENSNEAAAAVVAGQRQE
jgi:hypothetical protein